MWRSSIRSPRNSINDRLFTRRGLSTRFKRPPRGRQRRVPCGSQQESQARNKFPSKIKTGFQARHFLTSGQGFQNKTSGVDFKRRADLEQAISDGKLECYVWSESIGLTQYESLSYRDRSNRIRLLSSRHRVGNDQLGSLIVIFDFPTTQFQNKSSILTNI